MSLPFDVMYEVALTLNYMDILPLCRTSRDYREMCQSRAFWLQKAQRDYGTNPKHFDEIAGKTPQDKYKTLLDGQILNILSNLIIPIYANYSMVQIRIPYQENDNIDDLTEEEHELLETIPLSNTQNLRLILPGSRYGVTDDITYDNIEDMTGKEIVDEILGYYNESLRESDLNDIIERHEIEIPDLYVGYAEEGRHPFAIERNRIDQGEGLQRRDLLENSTIEGIERNEAGAFVAFLPLDQNLM